MVRKKGESFSYFVLIDLPLEVFVFVRQRLTGGPSAFSGWVVQRQDVRAMWVPSLLEVQMKSNAHGAFILCLTAPSK